MWTPQQKVKCVLWLAELKSVTRVRRRFRLEFNVDPPTSKSILQWDRTLKATGTLIPQTGKHSKNKINEETVDRVRTAFTRSPKKSIRRGSHQLQIPKSTVHDILHKRLKLRAYKLQLLHHIQPNDRRLRENFAFGLLRLNPIQNLLQLKQRIRLAVNSITPQMLQNTWREIQYRLDICRATRGAHIEI
ncbi:hypothetical protein C0J52_21647 [Blattella germanica]|nr:hypothetical protein C0J52_21647 [Blattella germanica]